MIRIGFAADPGATVQTKAVDELAAGFVLAGFGTQPPAAQICEDAIVQVQKYTATQIQKLLDFLLEQKCCDFDFLKNQMLSHIDQINTAILYASRRLGQGIYFAGAICYVANNRFLCLPFGSGGAYLWDNDNLHPLKNEKTAELSPDYLWDTLGGPVKWDGVFAEGEFPAGSQIVCATQVPPEAAMQTIMGWLTRTDPDTVANFVYESISEKPVPIAILDLIQT